MNTHAVTRYALFASFVLFSTSSAFSQVPRSAPVPGKLTATAATTVAYVYVQTLQGVNLYHAAANGELTLMSGSPFQTTGEMVGDNGKYLFSLGTHWIHVYPIAANGAIEEQVSQIDTQNYGGSDCGATEFGVLDHTGQFLYILINGAPVIGAGQCSVYQSYGVDEATGALKFLGYTQQGGAMAPLGITSSDKFAYTTDSYNNSGNLPFIGFARESSGALGPLNFAETDPTLPVPWNWIPWIVRADPANHLAVAIDTVEDWASPAMKFGPIQLASYSVDSQGNIVSTNTWDEMPSPAVGPTIMTLSPSGEFLAVGGSNLFDPACGWCADNLQVNLKGTGLQLFHFNGSQPITAFGKTLTTAPIDQIQWDDVGHLYALSESTNKLYVYTVTTNSITEVSGSPYTVQNPRVVHSNGLIVRPE